jgi:hypothetical protein
VISVTAAVLILVLAMAYLRYRDDAGGIGPLASVVKYENNEHDVLSAIEQLKKDAVGAGTAQAVDGVVRVLKQIVLDTSDTTPKGRRIRKVGLETIKVLRKHDLRRDFGKGELKDADLVGVDLQRVNMRNLNLEGAFLLSSNFEGSDLSFASLTGSFVRNVNFAGVTMTNTNLTKVDWFNAFQLTESQLADANRETIEPCPRDAAGRYSQKAFIQRVDKEYGFAFSTYDSTTQTALKNAWVNYARVAGLCSRVEAWTRK